MVKATLHERGEADAKRELSFMVPSWAGGNLPNQSCPWTGTEIWTTKSLL